AASHDHTLSLHDALPISQSVAQMVDAVLALPEGTKLLVLAPVVAGRKGEQVDLLEELRAQGFTRVRIDGRVHELDAAPRRARARSEEHTSELQSQSNLVC